jgi:hypothetical protein
MHAISAFQDFSSSTSIRRSHNLDCRLRNSGARDSQRFERSNSPSVPPCFPWMWFHDGHPRSAKSESCQLATAFRKPALDISRGLHSGQCRRVVIA